jgi:hypothetical protein
MSDPPGMKRSHDDPTSPHPKRHNTKQSNILHPSLSKKALELLKETLHYSLSDHVDEDDRLDVIYSAVHSLHIYSTVHSLPIKKEQRASFVDKEVFKTNVPHHEAFEDVVRKAATSGKYRFFLMATYQCLMVLRQ